MAMWMGRMVWSPDGGRNYTGWNAAPPRGHHLIRWDLYHRGQKHAIRTREVLTLPNSYIGSTRKEA